ncbi:hypothetical protein [Aureibacillus halotolerans]|uniref:Uncharacterized protein n=1 Tax=Aureibacillus halotolerans TaxID=1508390 RepID=A0A4V6PWE0_9BACI|nr:hypothetical protein [Aureibacillus halotolerans]TDQ36227.1 hypothetical protein EV213_11916 [Aureibacillus halotolerans]
MYAAVFGMFSVSWFGWAQENPKKSWRVPLGIASGLGFIVCGIGIYLSIGHWGEATALSDPEAFTNYVTFVWIEFVLAAVGAIVLLVKKHKEYMAPWIAFVVGVHFIWLKAVFQDPSLYVLAGLLIIVSIVAIPISKRMQVASSAITGIGAGTSLFAFAILGLLRFFNVS